MENPNEKTNPEREFEICIEYRLNRLAKVKTNDYSERYNDEDGCRVIDAKDADWQKEYESEHMTPAEMHEAFLEFIPELMSRYLGAWRRENDKAKSAELWGKVKKIQRLYDSLGGWEATFIEAWEV